MCLLNPPLLGNRPSLEVGTVSFALFVEKRGLKQIKKKRKWNTVRGDDRSEWNAAAASDPGPALDVVAVSTRRCCFPSTSTHRVKGFPLWGPTVRLIYCSTRKWRAITPATRRLGAVSRQPCLNMNQISPGALALSHPQPAYFSSAAAVDDKAFLRTIKFKFFFDALCMFRQVRFDLAQDKNGHTVWEQGNSIGYVCFYPHVF